MRLRLACLLLLLIACCPQPASAASAASVADQDPVGVWPLSPEPSVERGFDPPDDPWGAGHRGVDLLGTVGQVVRAALPGRVSWVGVLAGRGVVVVDHGGTRTTYEPVQATVEIGTEVGAGTPIGTLELAGSHCLPRVCLHWGWLESETYLDPLRLVGAGPARLLPLWRDEPIADTPADPMVVVERAAGPRNEVATGVSIGDASADPMVVVEQAARPRNEVATGVSRPGDRRSAADPVITQVVLPYEQWQSPLARLRQARGCACW
jgi:hypothetical protein